MRILPAGDRAFLVDLGEVSFDELHRAVRAIASADAVAAAIPGHESVLAILRESATVSGPALRALLDGPATCEPVAPTRLHRVRVSIDPGDAPDLPLLLERLQIEGAAFARSLRDVTLRARWLGFLSGFAYLEGLPREWQLPRRATPRQRVPEGSLGVAGPMAGLYPAATPGGWNLIGRTDARLWDPDRDPPNLIAAGDEVAIEVVSELAPRDAARASHPTIAETAILDVTAAGQMTRIVGMPDLRRYRFGLPPGGAFDPVLLAAANRGVGNPPHANAFECTLVGPRLIARQELLGAWTGAPAEIRIDGRAVGDLRQFVVRPGGALEIGRVRGGMRGWLAIRGGIASRAPRWSPTPERLLPGLCAGASLAVSPPRLGAERRGDRLAIDVRFGPHDISSGMRTRLLEAEWRVAPALDRVGIRIAGDAADLEIPKDLRSCGMQFGTVQWHPDGALVAMGPDHPVTGGYLQPMTVLSHDLWKLAQLQPGEIVRWIAK
jgi:KipI family sensor histidine kinase inhibitor